MIGKSRPSSREEVPALILSVTLSGEYNAFIHLLTQDGVIVHAKAYGATSRKGRGLWVPGNVIKAFIKKARQRTAYQVRGELLYGCAPPIMHSPILLLILQTICVLIDEIFPAGDGSAELFTKTLHFLSFLSHLDRTSWREAIPEYVRWEISFLRLSGFALDLQQCALTGQHDNLAFISPRTGRAVTYEAAGRWRPYLFRMPAFMKDPHQPSTGQDWLEALRITGHFLRRDVFSQKNRDVPIIRQRLLTQIRRKVETTPCAGEVQHESGHSRTY